MAYILKRPKLLKDIDDDELHHTVTGQEILGEFDLDRVPDIPLNNT